MPAPHRLLILLLGVLSGAGVVSAQNGPVPRRTPLTIGVTGAVFDVEGGASGEWAGAVGMVAGWGHASRWVDLESRLTVGTYAPTGRFDPTQFRTLYPNGRPLSIIRLEHQAAIIAPWSGLRPFGGVVVGNALVLGDRLGEDPFGFTFGVAAGARLERATGTSVGLGGRYRLWQRNGEPGTVEFTLDVRVPIR